MPALEPSLVGSEVSTSSLSHCSFWNPTAMLWAAQAAIQRGTNRSRLSAPPEFQLSPDDSNHPCVPGYPTGNCPDNLHNYRRMNCCFEPLGFKVVCHAAIRIVETPGQSYFCSTGVSCSLFLLLSKVQWDHRICNKEAKTLRLDLQAIEWGPCSLEHPPCRPETEK